MGNNPFRVFGNEKPNSPGIDTGKESIFFYRYKPLRSM